MEISAGHLGSIYSQERNRHPGGFAVAQPGCMNYLLEAVFLWTRDGIRKHFTVSFHSQCGGCVDTSQGFFLVWEQLKTVILFLCSVPRAVRFEACGLC